MKTLHDFTIEESAAETLKMEGRVIYAYDSDGEKLYLDYWALDAYLFSKFSEFYLPFRDYSKSEFDNLFTNFPGTSMFTNWDTFMTKGFFIETLFFDDSAHVLFVKGRIETIEESARNGNTESRDALMSSWKHLGTKKLLTILIQWWANLYNLSLDGEKVTFTTIEDALIPQVSDVLNTNPEIADMPVQWIKRVFDDNFRDLSW